MTLLNATKLSGSMFASLLATLRQTPSKNNFHDVFCYLKERGLRFNDLGGDIYETLILVLELLEEEQGWYILNKYLLYFLLKSKFLMEFYFILIIKNIKTCKFL